VGYNQERMDMNNLFDFKDKTVLVTGAGTNIGRSIGESFFKHQANTVFNDLKSIEECRFSEELLKSDNFLFSQGDITDLTYQQQLFDQVVNKFSKIDILINNAGIGSGKGFFDLNPKVMQKSIETNFIAPFFLSQKIARQMIENKIKGSVIFISSIHGEIPSGNTDYSSTKAALNMTIKELAYELGLFGIRVNGISPGKITSPSVKDERIPLQKQSGTPENISQAVLFLADNQLSGYITGQILNVDGGLGLTFDR